MHESGLRSQSHTHHLPSCATSHDQKQSHPPPLAAPCSSLVPASTAQSVFDHGHRRISQTAACAMCSSMESQLRGVTDILAHLRSTVFTEKKRALTLSPSVPSACRRVTSRIDSTNTRTGMAVGDLRLSTQVHNTLHTATAFTMRQTLKAFQTFFAVAAQHGAAAGLSAAGRPHSEVDHLSLT